MRQMGGRIITSLAVALVTIVGCTKQQPYEVLYKENVLSKSVVDTSAEYLYLPSVVEADRRAPEGRPYWVGEQKIVKFQWGEKELRLIEMDEDGRWSDNPTNVRTVMTIPVTHTAFRCAKDKYGDCTNKEEEVNDKSFADKGSFKPDMAGVSFKEINMMPLELDNLFYTCFSVQATDLVGYNFTEDGLDLQIERTWKASPECVSFTYLYDNEKFKSLSFKTRYNYSVVKLNKLATASYKPIEYPTTDENTFGFFNTAKQRLSLDNRELVAGQKVMINRWNSDRKEVVYNLSGSFAKPENKAILEATQRVFDRLNNGLRQANAGFQLKIGTIGEHISGDLKKPEIVLIDDPMDVGLLGYGPSITNPRTGEIVWARVAMYAGNMRQFIWREYNALVEEKRAEKLAAAGATLVSLSDELKKKTDPQGEPNGQPASDGNANGSASLTDIRNESAAMPSTKWMNKADHVQAARMIHGLFDAPKKSFLSASLKQELEMERLKPVFKTDDITKKMITYLQRPHDERLSEADKLSIHERLGGLDETTAIALTGAYPAALYNFKQAINEGAGDIVGKELKLWEELSEAEQQEIVDKVLPIVWENTLIHEVGHTLGLRHNFAGSEDKTNFYTRAELDQMGVPADRKVPYSSVMEYTYRDMNALNTLGKYDIAALRYAYAREVEAKDGSVLKLGTKTLKDLDKSLAQQGSSADEVLKPYKFCTDEHVDANANCNRFDEGTTFTEIADNLIESAEDFYKIRNFRNGRKFFSLFNDPGAIGGADYTMYNFRLFFEFVSNLEARYGNLDALMEDPQLGEEDKVFLGDILTARNKGFSYMIKTLTEPDVLCAMAKASNPNTIVNIVNLNDLAKGREDNVMSCFDPGVKVRQGYMVVAQGGKSFNSRRSSENEDPSADQIDVRGIWGSKIVALEYLLNRRMGSKIFDGAIDGYIDNPVLGPVLAEVLVKVLADDITRNVQFEVPQSGQKLNVNWTYSLNKTHDIMEPISDYFAASLGLLNGQTPFNRQISRALKRYLRHPMFVGKTEKVEALFKVGVCSELMDCVEGTNTKEKNGIEASARLVAGEMYYAKTQNAVALELFKQLDKYRDVETKMSKVNDEQLNKIYMLLVQGGDASALTPEEKAVYDLGKDTIIAFVSGSMKDEAAIAQSLSVLIVY